MKFNLASKLGPKMTIMMYKAKSVAPDVLIVGGLVTVIGGTVWLMKKSKDGREVVEEAEDRLLAIDMSAMPETTRKKEIRNVKKDAAIDLIKVYGPPVSTIAVGSASILWGHKMFRTRTMALMASNSVLQKKLTTLSERIDEEMGQGTSAKFQNGIYTKEEEETYVQKNGKTKTRKVKKDVVTCPQPYSVFFDEGSKLWHKDPSLNLTTLRNIEKTMTYRLHTRGIVFLEEVYNELDIPIVGDYKKKMCHDLCWVLGEGENRVDLGIFRTETGINLVNGYENVILLEPNVDGNVYDILAWGKRS